MSKQDWNYIAPARGRLPRGYEDPRSAQHKLRWLLLWIMLGAAFWGAVYWWAAH